MFGQRLRWSCPSSHEQRHFLSAIKASLFLFSSARAIAQPKSARPSVPISNATKRSFLVSPCAAENQSSPEVCNRYFLHPEDSEPL